MQDLNNINLNNLPNNARQELTITFSKAMNPDTLKLAGDLSSGTGEWTSATNANDTLTLSPNQAWVVGADKTLSVDCESDGGIVMDTLNAVYEVTYSITATPSLADASTITGTESIVITFDEPMDTTSVVISGSLINDDSTNVTAAWSTASETNDTITLAPANTIWPSEGADLKLTINGNSAYGPAMSEISLTYTVEYAVYVSSISNTTNPGNPTNPGTKTAPLSIIQDGIDYADSIYTTGVIRVAQGTYQSDYRDNGEIPVINMKEGISVYGGYSKDDWNLRNTTDYETIVEDTSTAGGDSISPNRVLTCNTAITRATVVDGFTIKLGKGVANAGIFCTGSPTIQNNKIQGIKVSTDAALVMRAYGIYNSSSSPLIKNNNIDPGWNKNGGSDMGYGIYNDASTARIEMNTINGGKGNYTYGVYDTNSSTEDLINNTIDTGSGNVKANCIYIEASSSPKIEENTLTNTSLPAIPYGIFEFFTDPGTVKNNYFNLTGLGSGGLYYDYDNGTDKNITNLTTAITTDEGSGTLQSWGNY